jgi:dihydroxyacetone kinase-like predicted kinase
VMPRNERRNDLGFMDSGGVGLMGLIAGFQKATAQASADQTSSTNQVAKAEGLHKD